MYRSTVLVGLHHARKLLQQVNQDYGGYRARALTQIAQAIQELTPGWQQLTALPNTPLSATSSQGKAQQAQANFDSQMRQALQYLATASQTLNENAGQLGGAQAANGHIQQAMKDLQEGLQAR